MTATQNTNGYSKHRLEALADGIFAVAMTLLVIELKIPESLHGAGHEKLANQLLAFIPKYIAWIVSFFVLALFWYSSHRQMHFVRYVDGKLIALKIVFLALVSFMPFTASLVGEFVYLFISQVFYSIVMFLLGCVSLMIGSYIYRHPELSGTPMPKAVYHAARFRTSGLLVIALMSMVIAHYFTAMGNMAFMLMIPIGIIARRIEKHLTERALQAAVEDKIQSI
jgi:uncharacterized membrane protein